MNITLYFLKLKKIICCPFKSLKTVLNIMMFLNITCNVYCFSSHCTLVYTSVLQQFKRDFREKHTVFSTPDDQSKV